MVSYKMCFRAIIPQNKNLKFFGKKELFSTGGGRGGGAYPSMENSMEIIFFLKPSLSRMYCIECNVENVINAIQ